MARPTRRADPQSAGNGPRTFFVTVKAHRGRFVLESARNATLLIDVLRQCVAEKKFKLHDFVVIPNHLHVLLTVHHEMSIERAMQFIKGRFSYRLKKECMYLGEVWQQGYSESRADELERFAACRAYIAQNPVKEGLTAEPDVYPYCYNYLSKQKARRG